MIEARAGYADARRTTVRGRLSGARFALHQESTYAMGYLAGAIRRQVFDWVNGRFSGGRHA